MTYPNKHNKKLRRRCLLFALLLSVWGSVSVLAEDPEDPLEQTQVGESSGAEPTAMPEPTTVPTMPPSLMDIIQGKLDAINGLQDFTDPDRISEIKNRQPTTAEEVVGLQNDAKALQNEIDSEMKKIPELPSLFGKPYEEWAAASEEEWKLPEGWEDFTQEAWKALPDDSPVRQNLIDQITQLKSVSGDKKAALERSWKDIDDFQKNAIPHMQLNVLLNKAILDEQGPVSSENPQPPTTPEETGTSLLDPENFRFCCLLAAFVISTGCSFVALIKSSKTPSAPKNDLNDFAGKSSVTELNGKLIALQNSIDALSKENSEQKKELDRLNAELEKRKSELSSNSAGGSGGRGESGGNKGPKKLTANDFGSPDTGRLTGEKLHLNYSPISETNCYFMPLANGEYELTDKNYILLARPDSGINELRGWKGKGLFFVYDAEVDGKRCSESEVGQISGFFSIGSVKMYPTVIRLSSGNYKLQSKGLLEMKR